MKGKFSLHVILMILMAVIAISAIYGGIILSSDPGGHKSGLSIDLLDKTPFIDYFFPGLFLIIFMGIGNVIGFIMTYLKNIIAGFLGILFGSILIIWISLQVIWMGYLSLLQPLMFILAAIEVVVGSIILRRVIKSLRLY